MEQSFPKLEERILARWKKEGTFEKSVEKRKRGKRFVFYEGPPTANGRPGLHHVMARAFKDVVLRYKTMRGFFVPRRAGWDTHGLPVELEVEKKLGLKSKRDIEAYGIARFNEACRKSVWEYQQEWQNLTERMGMWLDMGNPYITYKTPYIETLWHIIAAWFSKGLLYRDYKVVPYCTRCGTALSSHELAQGYKTVTDNTAYAQFKAKGKKVPPSTFFVAWTTTPWTLPGNVALAVGKDIRYVIAKKGRHHYVVAEELAESVLGEYETARTVSGKELEGIQYEPLFAFKAPEKGKKAWEVVVADFVSTQEGTGIVHTAVAYGAEDFELGKKENLAMLHLVDSRGRFEKEAGPFAGKFVKDADPFIIADLQKRGLLLKEEEKEHEYPFCWRCSTPLLYYAKESWFVDMQKVKAKLLANNRKVNWIPGHLKEGRMGEWLAEVRDWAFSRERYWGTPLPIWECSQCEAVEAVGSIQELADRQTAKNTYYIMRHGHSDRQVSDVMSSWPEQKKVALTAKGIKEVKAAVTKLHNVDVVISSDLLRCKQTAELAAKEFGVKVFYDKRLREVDVGQLNGASALSVSRVWGKEGETEQEHYLRRFVEPMPQGEDWVDVQTRMVEAVKDAEKKHQGKTILVISHELPLTLLETTLRGLSREDTIAFRQKRKMKTAEVRKVRFARFPYNKEMEIDLHRPFVDEVTYACASCKQGSMKRVKDVVDVWYDSGSMPFAQNHWMGEKTPKDFPADYIVEAIDQTRGWFYTLLAVSTLLGFGPSYKNVISLGHLLDEKGEKMSKSRGNVVSPWDMAERYGMDTVRWYFFVQNHPWDPSLFAERDLQQVVRRFQLLLWNSLVFYQTYAAKGAKGGASLNIMDRWIVSRLNTVTKDVRSLMDSYDITGAARMLESFVIEDLSLWYIRRSRNRFQNPGSAQELREASSTLKRVLSQTAVLMAPFMPFLSEHIFSELQDRESVHQENWPNVQAAASRKALEENMAVVRGIASKGLALRAEAGVKVRQPLSSLTINRKLDKNLLELLKEELNVKEVLVDEKAPKPVSLEFKLTPELKEEGLVRELIRLVQGMRKDAGLRPGEKARMRYSAEAETASFVRRNEAVLKKTASLSVIQQGDRPKQVFDAEANTRLGGNNLWIGLRKA